MSAGIIWFGLGTMCQYRTGGVPMANNMFLNQTSLILAQFLSDLRLEFLNICSISILVSFFNYLETFQISIQYCWELI